MDTQASNTNTENHDPAILATFGYYQATRNYIEDEKLELEGSLTLHKWPCVFVYDVLQLPGSLAHALERNSSLEIINYMTPAKFRVARLTEEQVHDISLDPAVNIKDGLLRGMAVFGRGKTNRDELARFYGDGYVRSFVPVEVTLRSGAKKTLRAYTWFPAREHGEKRAMNGLDEHEESPSKRHEQVI